MLSARALHRSATTRPMLLCLLMLALLLHGQAAALRQMLGAAHRHVAAEHAGQVTRWLQTAVDWRLQLLVSSPLVGGHGAPPQAGLGQHHHHDHSARHHHANTDATVVALESGGGVSSSSSSSSSDGSSSSLTQPLALGSRPGWAQADSSTRRWPAATAPSWQNAAARLPERPPRG